jgi:hypothetical protein
MHLPSVKNMLHNYNFKITLVFIWLILSKNTFIYEIKLSLKNHRQKFNHFYERYAIKDVACDSQFVTVNPEEQANPSGCNQWMRCEMLLSFE